MKENILKLREVGYSYKAIVKELNCSIGTVAYHCGEGQKEKTKQRSIDRKNGKLSNRKKIVKYCECCNSVLKNNSCNFCSITCHKEHQYNKYIENWKSGHFDGCKNGGASVSNFVRRYLFKKHDNKCSRCGWDTPNPYINKIILEIEHIDGNSENNREENLDLICPNCHSLTPTYKALNYGNGNKKRLEYNRLI